MAALSKTELIMKLGVRTSFQASRVGTGGLRGLNHLLLLPRQRVGSEVEQLDFNWHLYGMLAPQVEARSSYSMAPVLTVALKRTAVMPKLSMYRKHYEVVP